VSRAGAALQGVIWGAGPFEEIAVGAAPAHDALVDALVPRLGERWLDVATGTGAVALRAARAGANVTALDIAPAMLATARGRAAAAGLPIRFDLGEAERLPYSAASFDVVTSAQGVIFAMDPEAAARELARVCRPGGRLGLTCLIRAGLAERLSFLVGAGGPALAWGDPGFVGRLLGRWFALSFSEGDAPFVERSPEAAAALYARCYGPLRFFADRFGPEERAELDAELTAIFERFVRDGRVHAPRPFLLVLGTRLEDNER
jgi:SAM-dependent methyltransferase